MAGPNSQQRGKEQRGEHERSLQIRLVPWNFPLSLSLTWLLGVAHCSTQCLRIEKGVRTHARTRSRTTPRSQLAPHSPVVSRLPFATCVSLFLLFSLFPFFLSFVFFWYLFLGVRFLLLLVELTGAYCINIVILVEVLPILGERVKAGKDCRVQHRAFYHTFHGGFPPAYHYPYSSDGLIRLFFLSLFPVIVYLLATHIFLAEYKTLTLILSPAIKNKSSKPSPTSKPPPLLLPQPPATPSRAAHHPPPSNRPRLPS